VDVAGGEHLGSAVVRDAIKRAEPRLAVCGHIHACWTQEARVGETRVVNAGPGGVWVDL
jgi:Icc-related predicted phosphoesterase